MAQTCPISSGQKVKVKAVDILFRKLRNSTIHGIPDAATANGCCAKISWLIALSLVFTACLVQVSRLIRDSLDTPTVTKIDFFFAKTLEFPSLAIFPDVERNLNTDKVVEAIQNGSLTYTYINAVEWGVGTARARDWQWLQLLNPEELSLAYEEAIRNHGSILNARIDIQERYGLKCEEFFYWCTGGVKQINCCDIFELRWNMYGAHYALKPGALVTNDSGNLGGFTFYVEMWPRVALSNNSHTNETSGERNSSVDVNWKHSYIVGVSNGLDQTPQWQDFQYLHEYDGIFYHLRQRRRKILQRSDNCRLNPSLKYFTDYTINNCKWEKDYFDKLHLLNVSCELPLLQLLSPTKINVTNPCNFSVMQELYELVPGADFLCDMWCVMDKLKDLEHSYIREQSHNDCIYPCTYTEYHFTVSIINDPENLEPKTFSISMFYDTSEVETVEEIYRLSFNDYVGLIGGIFGLWLGASLVSFAQMVVILINSVKEYIVLRQSLSV